MPSAEQMAERHAAMLARLADAAERLALMHAERALTCDDPKIEASATASFHRAARSARQCAALEAKLLRDAEGGARETRRRAEFAAFAETETRKLQLKAATDRLIWTEADDKDHAERLCDELDDLLEAEALTEGFITEDMALQVAKLCKSLGLTGFEVLAVLPDGSSDPPPPQSSA
jgi:hypothetical protein